MTRGLKVNKNEASRTIQWMKNEGLLDNKYKIVQSDENVLIPMKSEIENENHLDFLEEFEIVFHNFEKREISAKSLREALEKYLPNIDENLYQTSFDQIGTIAVIDLKEDLLPFKEIVGQALIEVNPSIKTVYRKSSKVDGTLRIRELELIAGVDNSETIHREHGINIAVDIKKAYFSPRLATEHARVSMMVTSEAKVLDLFGSLAPFGLHITKRYNANVDTVDINQNVPTLINKSVKLNSLLGNLNIYTSDATEFTKSVDDETYDFIIMNHPSDAISYLQEAIRLIRPNGIIFYYDFIEMQNYEELINEKIHSDKIKVRNIHVVRQSSPSEYHLCVELQKIEPDQFAHQ